MDVPQKGYNLAWDIPLTVPHQDPSLIKIPSVLVLVPGERYKEVHTHYRVFSGYPYMCECVLSLWL